MEYSPTTGQAEARLFSDRHGSGRAGRDDGRARDSLGCPPVGWPGGYRRIEALLAPRAFLLGGRLPGKAYDDDFENKLLPHEVSGVTPSQLKRVFNGESKPASSS